MLRTAPSDSQEEAKSLLHGDTLPVNPDSDTTVPRLADNVAQPRRKWIVEPIALMFAVAMFCQVSTLSQYLYYRIGQQYNETMNATRAFVCNSSVPPNDSQHDVTSRIQAEASQWTLYRNVATSLVSLLMLPLFASSSDYLGRKPALLLPCLGMALDAVGLLVILLLRLPLFWLIASGVLGALGGGFGALFAALFAYLADTTSRRERPGRLAILEGTLGVAGAAMELVIGWWIRLDGYTSPMIFCTAVSLANLLYVILFVPEVRLKKEEAKSGGFLHRLAAPYANIAALFRTGKRLAVSLALLLASTCLFSASFIGSSAVSLLYQMNYPFCLDSVFLGYLNAAKIVCFQVGVAIGLLVLRRCLGIRPLGLSILGLASSLLGSLATGVAPNTGALFVAAGLALFSMLPLPMLRAHASQVAPADKQGALFSCIGVMEVCGNVAGVAAFTALYADTQAWMPGFVYLAVSASSLLALLLCVACRLLDCCGGGDGRERTYSD